jgi:hypothetical protein
VRGAARAHPGARFIRADVLRLPLAEASADLLLDRGCFHYLAPAERHRYAREAPAGPPGRRPAPAPCLPVGRRSLLRGCDPAGVRRG